VDQRKIQFINNFGVANVRLLRAGGRDCNPSPSGRYYAGNTSVTVSGRTCQRWTSQSPHEHKDGDDQFPDGSAAAAVNYCRNPNESYEGLWCYTTDPNKRWEACDVPHCGQPVCYTDTPRGV